MKCCHALKHSLKHVLKHQKVALIGQLFNPSKKFRYGMKFFKTYGQKSVERLHKSE